MENQFESKQNIVIELEKLCRKWNVYARRINRSRPKSFTSKMTSSP